MTIPFCKDCKHLIGKRHMPEHAASWKCGHQENIRESAVDRVTGETKTTYRADNCHEARGTSMYSTCGLEGKLFEAYVPPDKDFTPLKHNPKADDLLNELEGLK